MTEPKTKIDATIKREHLEKYQNSDLLPAEEAAAVISENSGHVIPPPYLSQMITRGWIKHAKKFGSMWQYPYAEIKDLVVSKSNRGPQFKEEVKPVAERVRRSRAKKRAAATAAEKE